MSNLFIDIQNELESGTHPALIAKTYNIPLTMVYDVVEAVEAMEEMPTSPMPTDEEIDSMAEYYGYGRDELSEFD